MRVLLLPGLTAGLLVAFAATGQGQEEPRAILAGAVKTHGETAESAQQCKAFRQKIKGTLFSPGESTFTGESFNQVDGAYKFVMHVKVGDTPFDATIVFNGSRGWMQMQGVTRVMDEVELSDMKKRARMNRMYSPVDLVQEKDIILTALGESTVEGEMVLGVQVKSKGMPDVNLYFSRASGLLLKTRYRDKEGRTGKEVLEEYVLQDYREVDWAMAEERVLRAARRPSDAPALLAFFRQQTLTPDDQDKIQALIRQLSDDSFVVREKASASLVAEGARAAALLRQAARDPELEVARRAQQCLTAIDGSSATALIAASARLLAIRQSAGAAEVLLAYLPCAPDEFTAREVRAALAAVALRDGTPDPVLVQALEDKNPLIRAAAEAALGRDGGAYQKQPGRRLYPPGGKYPTKYVTYQDGKKVAEHEVLEIEIFNQFPAAMFAQPR